VLGTRSAYEATLRAAWLNKIRGGSRTVYLTELGGGAFGNNRGWIHTAMRRALDLAAGWDLDVRMVSYSSPDKDLLQLFRGFSK